jgi:ABC-2 type transport system permease protein
VATIARTTIHASAPSRIYGLGSVFGKTLRDSRRATVAVAVVMSVLLIAVTRAVSLEFDTPASRQQLADIVRSVPPILAGMAGKPVNIETLGGYVNYKYGTFFPIVISLWSILALSGTLASEARRGSLEFLATGRMTRRTIALEKLGGHVVAVTIAVGVIFLSTVLVGSQFAVLPGDDISVANAAAYAVWLELLALAAGTMAFAVAPFFGRGAAVGIAGAFMFAGFFLNGYQGAIPALAPFADLTWFGWTTNHLPLAGEVDWAPLGLVALVVVVFAAIGVEAFARRDLGATSAIPTPSLPHALTGVRGPVRRAASEDLNLAVSWGLGLGLFGLVLAASGGSWTAQLTKSPQLMDLLHSVFPGVDLASVGGFLELVFVEFGLILAGLAAATLVGRWASTETSGRTEILLAAPLERFRWVLAEGVGALGAIVLITALTALGIAIGGLMIGGDVATPVVGSVVLGLYAAAFVGVGFAIGGALGTGLAAAAVAILTILTWALGVLGPALGLPEILQTLVLSSHYGEPMVGQWDLAGVLASIVLAVAGVLVGAWGFARRDLR